MAAITNYEELKFSDLLGELNQYKNNPIAIKTIILDRLSDITYGAVNIVDPSNPFTYLLESSCVNASMFIQENMQNMRDLYPRLSTSQDNLYRHMSDYDYLDRFATPSDTDLEVFISLNEFERYAKDYPSDRTKRITMPRDMKIKLGGYTFTLNYPIHISKHYNGVYSVRYKTDEINPFDSLSSNFIPFRVLQDQAERYEQWLVFKTRVKQIDYKVVEYPIEVSRSMSDDISITDQFFYARVYYKTNNVWKEMITTHTQQVFDPLIPTACLKVYDDRLNVFVPPIYTLNGSITGNLIVVVYTTKGSVNTNFTNYRMEDIQYEMEPINRDKDYDLYVDSFINTAKYMRIDRVLNGGADSVDFRTLKNSVIDNSIGDRKLPITYRQLDYDIQRLGYTVEKNIDVLTNRLFVVHRPTPKSIDRYPITETHFNMTTISESVYNLRLTNQVMSRVSNRTIIPKGTIFKMENGKTKMIDYVELQYLDNLETSTYINVLNNNKYLSAFYHYILDTVDNEVILRAYDISKPMIEAISFDGYNETVQHAVTSSAYSIEKIPLGYKIFLNSNMLYYRPHITQDNIKAYLVYKDAEGTEFYFESTIFVSDGKNPIYQFELICSGDIDNKNKLYIENAKSRYGEPAVISLDMLDNLYTMYVIDDLPTNYVESEMDYYVRNTNFTGVKAVVTMEKLYVRFGHALPYLWRRIRSTSNEDLYKTYSEDAPGFYLTDIYKIDPATGAIFKLNDQCQLEYELLHHKGDPMLDEDGNQIYIHHKGDLVLDENGDPVLLPLNLVKYDFDLLLVDHKSIVANTEAHVAYKEHVRSVITNWLITDLVDLNRETLENTAIYFRPKRSIDYVPILLDNNTITKIPTGQSLDITIYVKHETFQNSTLKDNLNYSLVKFISDQIKDKDRVSRADLIRDIMNENDDVIESIEIHGLAGDLDLELIVLLEEDKTLTLNKKLILTTSNEINLVEDINITYKVVDQT